MKLYLLCFFYISAMVGCGQQPVGDVKTFPRLISGKELKEAKKALKKMAKMTSSKEKNKLFGDLLPFERYERIRLIVLDVRHRTGFSEEKAKKYAIKIGLITRKQNKFLKAQDYASIERMVIEQKLETKRRQVYKRRPYSSG